MTEIVYQNSYSKVWDDGLLIHGKLMMREEVLLGYVSV
jgi:hypothetical protein